MKTLQANLATLRLTAQGAKWLGTLTKNLLLRRTQWEVKDHATWDEERNDILQRANWLCRRVLMPASELVKSMPNYLGEEFQGQWAIYSCSMLAHALANIATLYPDKATSCPALIARLIDMVNTPEMRRYDTMMWREDAMETLEGDNHHMTYLSILAWMITNYRLVGGDSRYDDLLHTLCSTLHRRMLASPHQLNLLSFPRMQIFLPDMLVTIVALHNFGLLVDNRYEPTVQQWLQNARTLWIHRGTGLLAGMLPGERRRMKAPVVRGSYCALNCSYLSMVAPDFAREQWERTKAVFGHEITLMGTRLTGIKEYLRRTPSFSFANGDAGLVVRGLSVGGTSFALGAPTLLGDWTWHSQLLRTAHIGGVTVKEGKSMRHYRLGEFAVVGEATALAMRTNVKR